MKTSLIVLLSSFFIFFLSSCAAPPDPVASESQMVPRLNCLVVLPVRTVVDDEHPSVGEQKEVLREGANFVDSVLEKELAGRKDVKILIPADVDYLGRNSMSGLAEIIERVGMEMNCDGVMVTTIHKYRQRDGGAYAVDAPASASFDMRIFHAQTKDVVWAADFDETQESFLSNIFSFEKMQKRGFKWVTVEDLVAQGVKDRLAECPLLKKEEIGAEHR